MAIFTKIKVALITIGVAVIGILSVLLQRVTHQKEEAERERDIQKSINNTQKEVIEIQSKINKVSVNKTEKPKEKAKEIILKSVVFLFIFFSVSCTKTEYITVKTLPELYTYDLNISMKLSKDGSYCVSEDEAYLIYDTLNKYREQINIYNIWRVNNNEDNN